MVPTHVRDAALGNCLFPCRKLAKILRISVTKSADRRNAHSVKVRARFSCIALKISVQSALGLKGGEFVARLREVVHPDVEIARFNQLQQAGSKNLKLLHAF